MTNGVTLQKKKTGEELYVEITTKTDSLVELLDAIREQVKDRSWRFLESWEVTT